MGTRPTICVLACDVSGDQNAAHLARSVLERHSGVRLIGAGGPAMRDAGVDVSIYTTHLSFTGVLGSLRILGELVSLFRKVQKLVETEQPDLVILTDAELVGLPFALWLRRSGVPLLFYFPPQVWLWGRWRLPLITPLTRRVLSAFREEAALYREAGADVVWTGHPLRDLVEPTGNGASALRGIGLDPERPVIALMPGSRRSEVDALAPALLGAARLLQERDPALQFALPVATESLRPALEATTTGSGVRDLVLYRPTSYDVLSRAEVVLQCSGTATLETALLGVPSVIAYRCIPIEYLFARLIARVDFIGMPNILLGEMVQPELFHKNVDAEHLAQEAWSLRTDETRRRRIISRLGDVRECLGAPGVLSRAATAVLELLPGAEPADRAAGAL